MGSTEPDSAEIRALARYLEEVSGIVLDDSKAYLFVSRCRPLLEQLGCGSLKGLLEKAVRDTSGRVRQSLIDAMSTNETSFFREPAQFSLLAHRVIPDHFEAPTARRLRIWSAAASTGQEPYSLAILLAEMFGLNHRYSIQIIGTDISDAALSRASKGQYSNLEISRGLSEERKNRYFVKRGDQWEVLEPLRAMVSFQRLNLLEPFKKLGAFDVILCRNVAIYFSPAGRHSVFRRLGEQLNAGGVLLVSTTESLAGVETTLARKEFRGVAYYQAP